MGNPSNGRPVIIIFGAALWAGGVPSPTLRRRVEGALRFGATLQRPLYLPTGGVGRHGPSEASVMAALLRQAGVPAEDIRPEETALDTTDSVFACAVMLRGWQGPVYAASSDYHLPRCVLLLRLAGLPAKRCPPLANAELLGMRIYRWAREALALPYDAALVALKRK